MHFQIFQIIHVAANSRMWSVTPERFTLRTFQPHNLRSLLLITAQIWSIATGWNGFVIPSNGCAIKIIGVCQRKCWIQPTELVLMPIGWTPGFLLLLLFLNSIWALSCCCCLCALFWLFPAHPATVWSWLRLKKKRDYRLVYPLCIFTRIGPRAPLKLRCGPLGAPAGIPPQVALTSV